MTLFDALHSISEQINARRDLLTNEETTKQVSILRFIRALGYDTSDPTEVRLEYVADPRDSGGESVDFAIMRSGEPILLIEAKAANRRLNDNYWRQLHDYFGATDVRFGLLTNGI